MTTGTKAAPAAPRLNVTRAEALRLFRTPLPEKPCDPSRRLAPFSHSAVFARSFPLPTSAAPDAFHAASSDGLPDATPAHARGGTAETNTVSNN